MKTPVFKPNARQRRALGPILGEPVPTFDPAERLISRDGAALRSAFTRFQNKHGADALVSFLKLGLEKRGEDRWRLDKLAPKPGPGGQTSILDAGR